MGKMAEHEKIVYAYVVADLLHVGHVVFLENAKSFVGENGKLIVGVLTDEATMEKKERPCLSFNERIRIVKALKCVDVVVAQTTYSPISNIKNLRPDILIESDSHTRENLIQTKSVADSVGAKVIILPYYSSQCSTKIKDNITKSWKKPKEVEVVNIETKPKEDEENQTWQN